MTANFTPTSNPGSVQARIDRSLSAHNGNSVVEHGNFTPSANPGSVQARIDRSQRQALISDPIIFGIEWHAEHKNDVPADEDFGLLNRSYDEDPILTIDLARQILSPEDFQTWSDQRAEHEAAERVAARTDLLFDHIF